MRSGTAKRKSQETGSSLLRYRENPSARFVVLQVSSSILQSEQQFYEVKQKIQLTSRSIKISSEFLVKIIPEC